VSVHGSADYGQMNVMQVLNGLEFFERLLNLIQYAKNLEVYDGEDRLSLLFLGLKKKSVVVARITLSGHGIWTLFTTTKSKKFHRRLEHLRLGYVIDTGLD